MIEILGLILYVTAFYGAYRVEMWAAGRRAKKGIR